MSTKLDITGQRFNHLVALYPTDKREGNSIVWHCKCDCGNEVDIGVSRLRYSSVTCGKCSSRYDTMRNRLTVWKTPKEKALANRFKEMIKRCYNRNCKNYLNYGGRGIYICDEWKSDRCKFVKWGIEHGFEFGLTLDRINNDGPYSPDNCRFVRNDTQNNNKRSNINITVDNVTCTISQWSFLINRDKRILYRLSEFNKKDLEWYIRVHWNRLIKSDRNLALKRIEEIGITNRSAY